MPLKVTYKNLQRGPSQKLLFTIENAFEDSRLINVSIYCDEEKAIKHTIDDMAEVQLGFSQRLPVHFKPERKLTNVMIFVKVTARKLEAAKDFPIKLDVTCDALKYSEQFECTDKWLQYIEMGSKECVYKGGTVYMINDLEIKLSVTKTETVTFAKLYEDTTLTDFHLSTAEGSVAIHKACLAAHSDIFKTMFSGVWKETTDGQIKLEGVSLTSLKHLKDYVYLGTLPEEGLRPLLLLSSYYFMDTLKTECILKLVKSVQPENLYSLLEFACENNIPELTFAILLQTPNDVVHETYQIMKDKEMCKQTKEESNISANTETV